MHVTVFGVCVCVCVCAYVRVHAVCVRGAFMYAGVVCMCMHVVCARVCGRFRAPVKLPSITVWANTQ